MKLKVKFAIAILLVLTIVLGFLALNAHRKGKADAQAPLPMPGVLGNRAEDAPPPDAKEQEVWQQRFLGTPASSGASTQPKN